METFLSLIFFSLAAFGAAWVVGYSKVSLPIRERLVTVKFGDYQIGDWAVQLLECPSCFGFWLGLIVGPFFVPFHPIACGLFVTGSNFLLGRVTGLIDDDYND